MRKLTINVVQLMDRIVADVTFVDELGAVGCITLPQKEYLNTLVQPRDRNDKLLEFLTRRSIADFKKFINVLSHKQAPLADLFNANGGEICLICVDSRLFILCVKLTVKLRPNRKSIFHPMLPHRSHYVTSYFLAQVYHGE